MLQEDPAKRPYATELTLRIRQSDLTPCCLGGQVELEVED